MKRALKWAGFAAGGLVLVAALAAWALYGLLRSTVPSP
jgi:hypothetical protein